MPRRYAGQRPADHPPQSHESTPAFCREGRDVTRHLRDDECMRVAADGDVEGSLAGHLDVCQTCTQSVNDWKAFIGALRMPAVWTEPAVEQHAADSEELVAKIRD